MSNVNKRELKKIVEELNKLALTEEVPFTDDTDRVLSDFMDAIEEIDDDGNIAKLDKEAPHIIDFYESFTKDAGVDEAEKKRREAEERKREEEERKRKEEEERKRKEEEEGRGGRRGGRRGLRRGSSSEEEKKEEPNPPERSSRRRRRSSSSEEEKKEESNPPERSSRRGSRDSSSSSSSSSSDNSGLPKGMRVGTIPAKIYEEINTSTADNPVRLHNLAEILAKDKRRTDVDAFYSKAIRTVMRKVSKYCDIKIEIDKGSEEKDSKFFIID